MTGASPGAVRPDAPHRARLLASRGIGDLVKRPLWPGRLNGGPSAGALDAAIGYLVRTHDATGREGSSKGFHLLRGWMPAYPETTGYVLGTLLTYARRGGAGADGLRERAREMGEWEISVQDPGGGIMEGVVGSGRPPIAFNTGMVLHGFLDLIAESREDRFVAAADRAAEFLVAEQDQDGAWRGRATYRGLATTYHSRVAWALVRYGQMADRPDALAAASRQLDWTVEQQSPNGWFDRCHFGEGWLPNTHAIAYTIRGLLESGVLLGEGRYVDAAARTSEVLIRKLEVLGTLPTLFDRDWTPRSRSVCLTGLVQLGDVWLKLASVGGDPRFENAGVKAVAQAASGQERLRGPAHGALPGSNPIFGRYAPLQYPNWATKFLADALITLEGRT